MNMISKGAAHGGDGQPETSETLRAALELEASIAKPHLEPVYRYLVDKADAGQPLPRWGERPHMPRIIEESGLSRGKVRFAIEVFEAWLPRFRQAFGEGAADEAGVADPAEPEPADVQELPDAQLIAELRREAAGAAGRDRPVFEALLRLATGSKPIPIFGRSVNIRAFATLAGTTHQVARRNMDALNRWAPRLRQAKFKADLNRDRLPGCDAVGTAVPTATLVAALEAALASEADEDARRLLVKLLEIARGNRELPRFGQNVHMVALCRSASIEGDFRKTGAVRVIRSWAGFFKREEAITHIRPDGTVERRLSAESAVREYLGKRGAKPLLACHKPPLAPSWSAIARELNRTAGDIMHGEAQRLVMEHWKLHGPGPVYEGMTSGEKVDLRTRRRELLAFIAEETRAGRPLPARGDRTRLLLDHDELVRRSGKPGANLADDPYFWTLAQKLDPAPTLARYTDLGGLPSSFDQLFDGFQAFRTKRVAAGSVSSTRAAARRAIKHFRAWLGKEGHDAIGDAFEEPQFSDTVAAIVQAKACGTPTRNFETEIRAARDWLAKRDADMLGDDLATVLSGAIRKDGRPLAEIIEGTGCDPIEVTNWMRGKTSPRKESIPHLGPLALQLGLDEDRLSKLVGPFARGGTKRGKPIQLPEGVRQHMPDNWQTLDPEEQRQTAQWIDDNLVHQNTLFGRTMREAARRRSAARKEKEAQEQVAREIAAGIHAQGEDRDPPDGSHAFAGGFAQDERDVIGSVEDCRPVVVDGSGDDVPSEPLAGAALKAAEVVGRRIDDQLTPEATGLGRTVLGELKSLRRHMTLNFPDRYLRRPGVKWRVASTAPMKLSMLVRFLRWQTSSEDDGGLGRDPAELTLADLLHPPLVLAYVDFKARSMEHVIHEGKKRGRPFTGSEVDFIQTVKSLVSTEFGFITQRPELVGRIAPDDRRLPVGSFVNDQGRVYSEEEIQREEDGEDFLDDGEEPAAAEIMPAGFAALAGEEFVQACRRAEVMYATAQRHVDAEAEMIRDPLEPIQAILDSAQPMTTLLRQLAIVSRRPPNAASAELQHHMFHRDLLLMRLYALTCLRSKNMRQITLLGTAPKLRFEAAEGKWFLEIPRGEFKNPDNAVLFGRRGKRQPYRKWIENTNGLYDLIDYYVSKSRPYFVKRGKAKRRSAGQKPYADHSELFVSSFGARLTQSMMWRAVFKFTARHVAGNPFRHTGIPLVMPFGPHSFRDIRATDILLHPETTDPYLEAALALQTGRQMIQDHYGIIRTERRTAQDDISFFKRENLAFAGLDAA